MMKKGLLMTMMLTLVLAAVLGLGIVTSYADAVNPTLVLDGQVLETPDPPVIRSGRTLLPAKILFESMGGSVGWDGQLRQTTITLGDTTVQLTIDSTTALVNGEEKTLDVPATIINSRTYVPVNFAATQLGCQVLWDGVNHIVTVNSPKKAIAITNIQVMEARSTVRVELSSDGVVENYRVVAFENPDRIVIDVRGAKLQFNGGTAGGLGISNDIFSNVRFSQFDADTVRAVVDLSVQQAPQVSLSQDKMAIYIDFTTDEVNEAEDPAEDDPVNAVEPADDAELAALGLPRLDWRMQGKLIVIDPGHGGIDSGSLGYIDGELALMEKDINLQIGLRLNELLQMAGASTAMTRTEDVSVGLYDRPEIANGLSAALFVSCHNNSNDNASPNGTEVHYSVKASEADQGFTSKAIAESVMDELEASMGLLRRGAKNSPAYAVLRCTEMPAIIIEGAFLSNPSDLQYMLSDTYVEDYALGVARGIIKALNAAVDSQQE